MATLDTTTTTYPSLQPADDTRLSLAYLPLEIVLRILEHIYSEPQIIPIDVYGPENNHFAAGNHNPGDFDMARNTSKNTKLILRQPPLYKTAGATCHLFRHMYRKTRPTLWGGHLASQRAHHVDLNNDLFHIRIHRVVKYHEWDGNGSAHLDPLANALLGIRRIATSPNYVSPWSNPWGASFLRHLNPLAAELLVLVPVLGLAASHHPNNNNKQLVSIPDNAPLRNGEDPRALAYLNNMYVPGDEPAVTQAWTAWWAFEVLLQNWLRLPHDMYAGRAPTPDVEALWRTTWRLTPLPALVAGYLVDAQELDDPRAEGLYFEDGEVGDELDCMVDEWIAKYGEA